MLKWLWITGVVFVLDQATKMTASSKLEMFDPFALSDGFNFTLMHNTGAAFSFLADEGGWQRWFFSVLAIVVSIVLVIWIKRLPKGETGQAIGLALVLGGALGNVFDRVLYGYVVDFIDVYYRASEQCLPLFGGLSRNGVLECHWPAFNIADSAISVGAVLLIALSFRREKPTEEVATEK